MAIPFQIVIQSERIIRGDFFPAQREPLGNLIICHGFKGFKDWGFIPHVAQTLSRDVNVITFNFSYNGVGKDLYGFTELEKFAKNTYARELEDVHTVVQHVHTGTLPLEGENRNMGSDLPLILLGHSRGAGVSLIYAFDHPQDLSAVISWNGISNVDLFSDEHKRNMRQNGRTYIGNARTGQNMPLDVEILEDIEANRKRYNIVERVKTSQTPIILIQGTEDHANLLAGSTQLMKNNSSIQRIEIPGGNHTFNATHPFQKETQPLREALTHTEQLVKEIVQRSPAE